nr:helix-turn-helix transcriptional regulator [Aquabacterium sp.]
MPTPLVFRVAQMPAQGRYPQHQHPWGEFVYAFCGVIEVKLAGQHVVAPPQLGIWLPPNVAHQGLNRAAALHSSLYVAAPLCAGLPTEPGALAVSPLARALLAHLRAEVPTVPPSAEAGRLMQVLVDQLAHATPVGSYLPRSDDPVLAEILQALEQNPSDPRSLSEWARAVHCTERTLSRRAQRDLGMSLAEWRQRLRVVKACPRLQAGDKVATVAAELGYQSTSAFIAMFRKMTGMTPDEHRHGQSGPVQGAPASC